MEKNGTWWRLVTGFTVLLVSAVLLQRQTLSGSSNKTLRGGVFCKVRAKDICALSSSSDFAQLETLFFYLHHCLAIAEHHQCLIPTQPIIVKIKIICKKKRIQMIHSKLDSQPMLRVEWTTPFSMFRQHL